MALTVLQMVQQAEAELGLPQSASVFGPGVQDNTGIQMGALANRVLDELRRLNRWTQLQFEYDLVVTPPIITTGNIAPVSNVITNVANLVGVTPQSWQVFADSLPIAARVSTVDNSSQVTLSMESTNNAPLINTPLTFARDTYPMPVGFDWFQNRSMWDRTNRWELLGPDSPQMDQWHRSGIVVTGPRRHFRQLGPGSAPYVDQFRLWPPPAEIVNPLQLVFEYLSSAAVVVNGTPGPFTQGFSPGFAGQSITYAKFFANDSDQPVLDDQAIILGIKWMFWEAKGFGSYSTMQNRWVDYVDRLVARDGAAPTLSVVKRVNPIFISPANVQDGFFPGPVGPNAG